MNNILFVQPIFYPNENVGNRNIESLTSIKKYYDKFKTNDLNVTFVFGGWAFDDAKWELISNHVFSLFGFKPFRFDKNYGKAIVVNNLIKFANDNNIQYENILTCDSDILFSDETPEIFTRLIEGVKKIEEKRNKPFGVFGLNQLLNNCHMKNCYDNTYEYFSEYGYKEKIVWPNASGGIAGGCLFVSKKGWNAINGYRVLGCYAGDDAYLMVDLVMRGFTIQMFDTVGIVHPGENDQEYQQWKIRICQRDSHGPQNKDILAIVKEAEDFWKTKQ